MPRFDIFCRFEPRPLKSTHDFWCGCPQPGVLKFGDFLSDGNLSNAAKSMQALKSLISRGVWRFFILRQHRTIASASLRRLFAPLLPFEKREIHTVFETVEKGLCPFSTKGLQSAARTICTPLAYKSHTCSLSCIFCQVHAPTENDQNPFAACGRQTLRGFFDTLKYIQDSFVFQTLNWGKNPVWDFLPNCAVVP